MKKVELTLTQVNYIIEESFNKGTEAHARVFSEQQQVEAEALKELKEALYTTFKFEQPGEPLTLEMEIDAAAGRALVIIKTFVDANKGTYSPFIIEDVFDEETDQFVDPDFIEQAFEFIADTQYDTNETMFMLALKWQGNDIIANAVTETGIEAAVLVSNMPVETQCALADYITSL